MKEPRSLENKIVEHKNYANDIFGLDNEKNGLFKYKCDNCNKTLYVAVDNKYHAMGPCYMYSGRSLLKRSNYQKSNLALYLQSNKYNINSNDIGNIMFHLSPSSTTIQDIGDNLLICNNCFDHINKVIEFYALLDPKFYTELFDPSVIFKFRVHLLDNETIDDIIKRYRLIMVEQ